LAFDGKPELFSIKTGCELVCRLPGLQQEISAAVEKIRDVTYEAALLANRHFVRCMEENGVLTADCYSQIFFYSCMQLVAGKAPPDCPLGLEETTFADLRQTHASYALLRPDNLPQPDPVCLWNPLAASAVNMDKDARNHVVSNFSTKAQQLIFLTLGKAINGKGIEVSTKNLRRLAEFVYEKRAGMDREWPPSVTKPEGLVVLVDEIAEGIDLGPTPVTEETLFARPQAYMPFFYHVLKSLEAAATHGVRDSSEKTSPPLGWVKRKGAKLVEWSQLSNTARRRLVTAIRHAILHSRTDILTETHVCRLSPQSQSYLERLVSKTRSKILANTFQPKMNIAPRGSGCSHCAPCIRISDGSSRSMGGPWPI
jgi:hypothetical protein